MNLLVVSTFTWKKLFFNIFLTTYSQLQMAQMADQKKNPIPHTIKQEVPVSDTIRQELPKYFPVPPFSLGPVHF